MLLRVARASSIGVRNTREGNRLTQSNALVVLDTDLPELKRLCRIRDDRVLPKAESLRAHSKSFPTGCDRVNIE